MAKVKFLDNFKDLNPQYIYDWPNVAKIFVFGFIFVLTVFIGYFLHVNGKYTSYKAVLAKEEKLKDDWKENKEQAINLEGYRKQLVELETVFQVLLKQLPNATNIDSLLIDINQAGVNNGMQFDLFKPQKEKATGFYSELPINLKLSGTYNQIGMFTNDVAKVSRIVLLDDVKLTSTAAKGSKGAKAVLIDKNDTIVFEATAKTYRYVDKETAAANKAADSKAKKAKTTKKK